MGLPERSKSLTIGLTSYTHYRRVSVLSGVVAGVACVKKQWAMALWRKVKYQKYRTDIAIFWKPTPNTEPSWKIPTGIAVYRKTDTDLKYW